MKQHVCTGSMSEHDRAARIKKHEDHMDDAMARADGHSHSMHKGKKAKKQHSSHHEMKGY